MANTPSMTTITDTRFDWFDMSVHNVVTIAKDNIDGNTGLTNDNCNENLTVDEELAIRLQKCMGMPSKRKARKSGKKRAKKSVPIDGQRQSVANTSGAGKQINKKKKKKNKKKNKKSFIQSLYVSDNEDELAAKAAADAEDELAVKAAADDEAELAAEAAADDEAIVFGETIDVNTSESNFSHKYESRQHYSGRQFRQKRQKFKANQSRDNL